MIVEPLGPCSPGRSMNTFRIKGTRRKADKHAELHPFRSSICLGALYIITVHGKQINIEIKKWKHKRN